MPFNFLSMAEDFNLHRLAESLGFDCCGVVRARKLTEHEVRLKNWLDAGMDGGLAYMRNHFDKRLEPALLFPNTRSVICCGISYKRDVTAGTLQSRFASYAWGRDYHEWMKAKLNRLLHDIQQVYPEIRGRAFVDTAPILEKAWAVEAGLGWIGKHSLVIHPKLGSYLLLGILLIDGELPGTVLSHRIPERCGSCRKCIDACPARALTEARQVDARRCIARLTIEKNPAPEHATYGWIFGCDLCQQVCPHNKLAPIKNHPECDPIPEFLEMAPEDWVRLSEADFNRIFSRSPLGRCGLKRIQNQLVKEY